MRQVLMNDRNVWTYIEGLPGQAAPWYEWRFNLEKWAGFQNFQQKYLKLTSDRAMAIECPTDCGLGCPRKVVEHAVNDIDAVCPDQEEGPLQIEQRDILIYKINQSIFHGDLCSALGIEHRGNKADNCRRTWRLGDFIPTAGMVFPVYYTHPQEEDGLAEVVRSLCLLNSNPFVVITPTRRYLSPVAEGLLAQRKAILLALNEEIIFTGQSGLKANRSRDSIFRSIMDEMPKPDSGGMVHFNTPAGINWGEITIQFVDGHTVSIQADHVHGRYNYTQMGMVIPEVVIQPCIGRC